MACTPHPEFDEIVRRMGRLVRRARSWRGDAYRSASVRYADRRDLLSGRGSRDAGGRWNPLGSFDTVYLSSDVDTAWEESFAHHRHYGIPIYSALPRTFVAVQVNLQRLLYLVDGEIRQRLRISEERMLDEPWHELQDHAEEALTQTIGRAAFDLGLEGLVVPSAESVTGENLVIFPHHLRPGSELNIINASELPRFPR